MLLAEHLFFLKWLTLLALNSLYEKNTFPSSLLSYLLYLTCC